MAPQMYTCLSLVLFASFTCSSYGYQFSVGGRDGWVLNPSESYSHWAQRLRFQVNDTLLFKYKKGVESVLEVNKDDFDNCNTSNPKVKLEDGNSIFKFDRSGPFYFITANKSNCDKGQKIIIVVLAVRTPPSAKTPPHAPTPTAHAPASSSPPKGSPLPPSPAARPPVNAPTPAPTTGNTPEDTHPPSRSPPHHSFAAPAFTSSVVLVSTVSLVLSVALGGFIVSS
ncbi:early nodulin-like protein 1 [Abeliophyllum distichum]|uniref:Early nodulin-like protein 1 n=1 Tax=Abeliophyllum distichum TaxID=126358 RepID=A0ABD1QJF0_9LAMI